jgi:hypothetical protein
MKRAAAVVATIALIATTAAGCGGDSEYCAAVKEHQSALDSFGKKKTDAAFKKYRRATNSIAKVAPESVKDDWDSLTQSMVEVKDAQKAAGLKLQDVTAQSVAALGTQASAKLVNAYESFTDAAEKHGAAIAADVKDQCGVKLK